MLYQYGSKNIIICVIHPVWHLYHRPENHSTQMQNSKMYPGGGVSKYMYITQYENVKKYFNMTSSQPDQLQHKSFQQVTWSSTAPSVKHK